MSLRSLRLASESISPHKEHEEDLLAALMIPKFYNDLDTVFAIPFFLREKRESLESTSDVKCSYKEDPLILGNRDFVVTVVSNKVS